MREVGWIQANRKKIHGSYFCRIAQRKIVNNGVPLRHGNIVVVGNIVSDSYNSIATWESPLEGDNAEDSGVGSALAMAQSGYFTETGSELIDSKLKKLAGYSTIGSMQSVQIWSGSSPIERQLTLEFIGFQNPLIEVEYPIYYLQEFMLPKLSKGVLFDFATLLKDKQEMSLSQIPDGVSLSIGRAKINADWLITDVSIDEDKVKKHKTGNKIGATVMITLRTRTNMSLANSKNNAISTLIKPKI